MSIYLHKKFPFPKWGTNGVQLAFLLRLCYTPNRNKAPLKPRSIGLAADSRR